MKRDWTPPPKPSPDASRDELMLYGAALVQRGWEKRQVHRQIVDAGVPAATVDSVVDELWKLKTKAKRKHGLSLLVRGAAAIAIAIGAAIWMYYRADGPNDPVLIFYGAILIGIVFVFRGAFMLITGI